MPVYNIIFSNEARPAYAQGQDEPGFSFRIDAASADDALGLAEIEFAQKHPQMLRSYYRPHVAPADAAHSSRVQHFDRGTPLNPDQ